MAKAREMDSPQRQKDAAKAIHGEAMEREEKVRVTRGSGEEKVAVVLGQGKDMAEDNLDSVGEHLQASMN